MLMLKKWKVTNNFFRHNLLNFIPSWVFEKKINLQPDLDPNYLPQGIKQVR